MGEGLAKLVTAGKGAGDSLSSIAKGIFQISAAGLSTSVLGAIGIATTLGTISKYAAPLERIGGAFKEINLAMSGSKADYLAVQQAVEGISKANMKGGGMLSELATLLKSPLKVEFANSKVGIVSDISLYIDGDKLMQKSFKADAAVQRQVDAIKMGINKA